jgi:hypothetical protein
MPQAKLNRPALPPTHRSPGRPGTGRWALPLGAGALTAAVAAASLTAPGGSAIAAAHRFLEFYSGVFSLVALSTTVLIGLAATDRVILMIRHRVLLQAVHRSMATTAMIFLAVHVAMKVMEGHARGLDVVVPFMASHRVVYVGLGTLASYLMILATWTGLARGRFAGGAHPGLWRALHGTAYASWVCALAHGLESGRSAKTWVVVSYAGCLIMAGLALLVRLHMTWNRRLRVARAQTLNTIKAAGAAPPAAPAMATEIPVSTVDAIQSPSSPVPARQYLPDRPAIARVPAAEAARWRASADLPPLRTIESRPSTWLPGESGPVEPKRWPRGRAASPRNELTAVRRVVPTSPPGPPVEPAKRLPVSGHAARSSPGPAIPELPAGPPAAVEVDSDDDFIAFLRGEAR